MSSSFTLSLGFSSSSHTGCLEAEIVINNINNDYDYGTDNHKVMITVMVILVIMMISQMKTT